MSSRIVDVAVLVAGIETPLSYAVPVSLDAATQPGVRVVVHVGTRSVVGLVLGAHPDGATPPLKLRPIDRVLDDAPVVTAEQLALVRFVHSYYLADVGSCARLVMPPDTDAEVAPRFTLTERGEQARVFGAAHGLSADQSAMLARFSTDERKTLRQLGVRKERVAKLVQLGLVAQVAAEEPVGAVRMLEVLHAASADKLPKRSPGLAAFFAWVRAFAHDAGRGPTMAEAQAALPDARGKARRLEQLGALTVERTARESHAPVLAAAAAVTALTAAQEGAVAAITDALRARASTAFLLEGVTGSGKTEVYLRALLTALELGHGALLLVPEIALTPQLVGRVSQALGPRSNSVVVLHSGLSIAERRDGLARLRSGHARVAVGARSALFAPIHNLGLIVVDEEHDSSLKQDESPRYHARDIALWRARAERAVCVLGSATPSFESRHNAALGKLVHLELPARVGGGGALPRVELIDLRARKRTGTQKSRDLNNADGGSGVVLSAPLVAAMAETLAAGDQVLLFLNKRGYASAIICPACGEHRTCPDCSVALTWHRGQHALVCHQCGHTARVPVQCPACNEEGLTAIGTGTERIEAEVTARFPAARIARLDRDTTAKKGELLRVLQAVRAREVDILVGTQMVAKGHDFPHLSLVGIVLADVALALPDFRASERAFALLLQVAGRAGRGDKPGRVLVQTFQPENPVLTHLLTHDVKGFARHELPLREELRYPPFSRMALVRIENADASAAADDAATVASRLLAAARALPEGAARVLGPAPCAIERRQGRTRLQVLVRARSAADRTAVVAAVAHDAALRRALQARGSRLILDLDPFHML